MFRRKSDVEAVIAGALTAAQTKVLAASEKAAVLGLGKSLELDKAMLDVLPEVLKKEPAQRGSFDFTVLTQLQGAIASRVAEFDKKIEEGAPAKAERAAGAEAASKAAEAARDNRDSCNKAAADAKKALAIGLEAVKQTDTAVSRFLPDLKASADALDAAKREVTKFAEGVYAAFTELRDAETPPPPAEPAKEPAVDSSAAPLLEAVPAPQA